MDAIKYREQNRTWQKKYDALAPKAGDMAPDFELAGANGGNPVRLSSLRGKPIALNFGSYT
ncbi:MAG: redoxin domain-containing protein [Chloroflexi bacterium]|nr:redoxin domain-containing protein [Chloroflexota bacterium]